MSAVVGGTVGAQAQSMRQRPADQGFSIVELLVIVMLVAIIAAMAAPMTAGALTGHQLRSESKSITGLVALAKLRAAATFTRARVFADLTTHRYRLEVWNRTTDQWNTEGGTTQMPVAVRFGFGVLADPPPNTQAVIGQSSECRDDDGDVIADTACIVFNSRGIPIDGLGAPVGGNAVYVTDGVGVRATTVTATPLIREWWSPAHGALWVTQ